MKWRVLAIVQEFINCGNADPTQNIFYSHRNKTCFRLCNWTSVWLHPVLIYETLFVFFLLAVIFFVIDITNHAQNALSNYVHRNENCPRVLFFQAAPDYFEPFNMGYFLCQWGFMAVVIVKIGYHRFNTTIYINHKNCFSEFASCNQRAFIYKACFVIGMSWHWYPVNFIPQIQRRIYLCYTTTIIPFCFSQPESSHDQIFHVGHFLWLVFWGIV